MDFSKAFNLETAHVMQEHIFISLVGPSELFIKNFANMIFDVLQESFLDLCECEVTSTLGKCDLVLCLTWLCTFFAPTLHLHLPITPTMAFALPSFMSRIWSCVDSYHRFPILNRPTYHWRPDLGLTLIL